MILLRLSSTLVPLICLWNARAQWAILYRRDSAFGPRLNTRVVFPDGRGIHHVYAPIYAGPGSPCWLLDIVLSRVLAENETHHGDTSPGWEGNTHLRMRLRSQGTDYRGPFLDGQAVRFLRSRAL